MKDWTSFEKFGAVFGVLVVLGGLGWYLARNEISGTSAFTPPPGAMQFYVSETGSDLNPGTQDRPMRTLRKALELPVAATKALPIIVNVVGDQYGVMLSDKITPLKITHPDSVLLRGWDAANSKEKLVKVYESASQGGGLLSFEVKKGAFAVNYLDFELPMVDTDAAQGAKVEVAYNKFRKPLFKPADDRLSVEAWDTATITVARNEFSLWGDPKRAADSLGPEGAINADNHSSNPIRITGNTIYFPQVAKSDTRLTNSGLFPLVGVKLYRNTSEVAGNLFTLEKGSSTQGNTDRFLGVWSVFGEGQLIYDNTFTSFGGVAVRIDAPGSGMGQAAKVEKNRS